MNALIKEDLIMIDYQDPQHEERRKERSDLLDSLDRLDKYPLKDSGVFGAQALERALEEWRLDVVEPEGTVTEHRILDYINFGLGWSQYGEKYKNRGFAWCGAFAAFAWSGSVSFDVRFYHFASTYRLQEWARGSKRLIKNLEDAQEGDLIVVGKGKAWGDHITLFERIDDGGYWSVEGNAWGETPSGGARREGVIRRWRAESEIHAIYRPISEDYERRS